MQRQKHSAQVSQYKLISNNDDDQRPKCCHNAATPCHFSNGHRSTQTTRTMMTRLIPSCVYVLFEQLRLPFQSRYAPNSARRRGSECISDLASFAGRKRNRQNLNKRRRLLYRPLPSLVLDATSMSTLRLTQPSWTAAESPEHHIAGIKCGQQVRTSLWTLSYADDVQNTRRSRLYPRISTSNFAGALFGHFLMTTHPQQCRKSLFPHACRSTT